MGGCPNGAIPAAGAAGTVGLLTIDSLAAGIVQALRFWAPHSVNSFRGVYYLTNELCLLNPDPPKQLTAEDFADNLLYGSPDQDVRKSPVLQWIEQYLLYQTFLARCVCRPITVAPELNCWHATSIVSHGGTGTVIATQHVDIETAVRNSWQANVAAWRVHAQASFTYAAPPPVGSHLWDVQVQNGRGDWVTFSDSRFIGNGTTVDLFWDFNNPLDLPPASAQMRILMAGAVQFQLATFDWCWRPLDAAPQPLPPDPDGGALPQKPDLVCSTSDLCSMIEELSRQLSRVSGQVADIQASVTGTDALETISSIPITGEGEITAVSGTRAVSVELTSIGPGVFTSALGRPRGLMRAGSVRWGTGSGYSPRVFIDGDRWVVDRPQGGLTISYQLINGVTATLHWLR